MNPINGVIQDRCERPIGPVTARRRRIILADAHQMVCEGLARLLTHALDVVAVAHTGDALLEAARHIEADLILSDVAMPQLSGLAVLKQLRAEGSRVPFVFLTMHGEPMVASEAMRSGANGYVLKSSTSRELLDVISDVIAGGFHVAASVTAGYIAADDGRIHLSERQRGVLDLVAQGFSSKQIGRLMTLSVRTVEAHKYSTMQMLRVHSSVELVRRARELGFLVC